MLDFERKEIWRSADVETCVRCMWGGMKWGGMGLGNVGVLGRTDVVVE